MSKNKFIESQRNVGGSYDKEKRTIEVVFATERPVFMRTWEGGYNEVLSMSGGDFDRLESGAAFLDNHDRFAGHKSVLGRVESVRVEGKSAIATIKISAREELAGFRQDLEDGILSGISVGYRVYEYEKDEAPAGETPTYTATRWEAMEVSYAPVQADKDSKIRSEERQKSEVNPGTITRNLDIMKEEEKEHQSTATAATDSQRSAEDKSVADVDAHEKARQAVELARQAEQDRIRGIRELCKIAGQDPEKFISDGTSTDNVRAALVAAKTDENQKTPVSVRTGEDGDDKMRAAMIDGLLTKATGKAPAKAAPGHESFRGLSLVRFAEKFLTSRGIDTSAMSNVQIARMAMNRRAVGYHTSSDFPILLTETVERSLRQAYANYPSTFQQFCRRESFPDFRPQTRVQISGLVGGLDEIPESGEYKAGSFKEAGETYSLAKYGKLVHLTWESLVNDDLSAFSRAPTAIALRARQLQSQLVYGVLSGNPEMADGEDLFSAAHGNLASSGAAISVETLSAARLAMRRQTDLNDQPIWVTPSFLVTSPENETTAEQVLNLLTVPQNDANTNPFKQSLTIISEPYLLGDAWYLAASPGAIDTIEYSFLDGEELYTDTKEGFDVDGVSLKIRMVFGTKAIDHRGLYKNPGA